MFVRSREEVVQQLSTEDQSYVEEMKALYAKVLDDLSHGLENEKQRSSVIETYNRIGQRLKEIAARKKNLHVYSFTQPPQNHGSISRVVAKLRDNKTEMSEFIYYTQRAFEFLFSFAFGENIKKQKNYFFIPTPLSVPVQNYAVHKLPDLDEQLHNTVTCVMLRGALLPSLIIAKEIQEYSSIGYISDFALFRIRRDESNEGSLRFILDESFSYLDLKSLEGKDLIFADPMNATAGSLLTILQYLDHHKVRPRSIKLFHIITSLAGALQTLQYGGNIELYTLWLDPVLNSNSYILPGLGDAGDRIHGEAKEGQRRNIIQLISNYGNNILKLYRAQIQKIEERILGPLQ